MGAHIDSLPLTGIPDASSYLGLLLLLLLLLLLVKLALRLLQPLRRWRRALERPRLPCCLLALPLRSLARLWVEGKNFFIHQVTQRLACAAYVNV